MTRMMSLVVVAGLMVGALMLGGCSSDRITQDRFNSDPTPELKYLARSKGQGENLHARTIDTYGRSLNEDIERILLLHRPTHLHVYPMP